MKAQSSDPLTESAYDQNFGVLVKRFLYLLGSLGVREILLTVFFIVMARKSPVVYGQFMLAIGIGATLLIFTEFGLNQFLVTCYGGREKAPDGILLQVTLLKSILWFIASLVVLGAVVWQQYSGELIRIVVVFAVGTGFEALANTFFVVLQIRGQQAVEGGIRSLAAMVAVSYALILLLAGAAPLWVACFKILEVLLTLTMLAVSARRNGYSTALGPAMSGITAIIPAVATFGFLQVAAILYNKINLFYLQKFGGSGGVAQYSAAWQIVDGISIIASGLLLQKVLYPVFMRLWTQNRGKAIQLARETAKWLLLSAAILVFLLIAESDRIIGMIFGWQYTQAILLQQILAPTILCAFLHNLAAFLMMAMGKERLILLFYLVGLVFNIACCSFLIPGDPVRGACLSILFTKTIVMVMSLTYCQRQMGLMMTVPVIQVFLSLTVGGIFFLLLPSVAERVLAECLFALPLLLLAAVWWRSPLRN